MEKFKKQLKGRIFIYLVAVAACIAMMICSLSGTLEPAAASEWFRGYITGLQGGMSLGLSVVIAVSIIKIIVALKDENKLRAFYNRENDERMKAIREKSGGRVVLAFSLIIVFTGLVAAYYNEIISLTLIICGIGQMTLGCILKIYYMKKLS